MNIKAPLLALCLAGTLAGCVTVQQAPKQDTVSPSSTRAGLEQAFIDTVREGSGNSLKTSDDDLVQAGKAACTIIEQKNSLVATAYFLIDKFKFSAHDAGVLVGASWKAFCPDVYVSDPPS